MATTTSSWARGDDDWSGSRNPILSIDDDEDESVRARGCEGMATVATTKKMGAESGQEAVYNAWECGSREGERGC